MLFLAFFRTAHPEVRAIAATGRRVSRSAPHRADFI
jgi:hypothetical protein